MGVGVDVCLDGDSVEPVAHETQRPEVEQQSQQRREELHPHMGLRFQHRLETGGLRATIHKQEFVPITHPLMDEVSSISPSWRKHTKQ